MNDFKKKISENLNKNYELFSKNLNYYFEVISKKSIDKIIKNISGEKESDSIFRMDFFNNTVQIDINAKTIFLFDCYKNTSVRPLDEFSSSIILHYILNADGSPVKNEWIQYRDLPDGLFYSATIPPVLQQLVTRYRENGKSFVEKILSLGGKRSDFGKYSAIIHPFKRFPMLFILDEADDEFEASVRVLFDSSAPHYMKSDIIKTLVVYVVKKLLK